MDHRHAVAYLFILLIVAGLAMAWWFNSGHWRARRRSSREFERRQRERRADEVDP
jgi:FtsZ-interacting cell division protein ZipA